MSSLFELNDQHLCWLNDESPWQIVALALDEINVSNLEIKSDKAQAKLEDEHQLVAPFVPLSTKTFEIFKESNNWQPLQRALTSILLVLHSEYLEKEDLS